MKSKIPIISTMIVIFLLSMISMAFALRIDSVSMTPNEIAPGENSKITLVIKNNGDNEITDVTISLDFTNLPLAPYNSDSDFSINQIDTDKSKQNEFEIIALNDAKSGIYKIPVKISYKENDLLNTKSSLISIMVNSKPIMEVSAEDGLLLKGKDNKVSLKIINKGLADVKFLEVETGSSTQYTLLSQKKIYIGDVDSNDFQSADFNLFFSNNAPNIVNFPVTIKYKDITNKEYSEDFTIPLKVYNQKQAQKLGLVKKSNTGTIIIGIIVVIIVFLIYRAVRRSKSSEY